jgi:hypothetical protein
MYRIEYEDKNIFLENEVNYMCNIYFILIFRRGMEISNDNFFSNVRVQSYILGDIIFFY